MKKLIAILMTLCLLCASCAALADMVIPEFDSMPQVVIEDDETTVNETAFFGEWVLNVAFADMVYVDDSTLFDKFNYNFMPIVISEGKISQDEQQENGEFITREMAYTFEAGQLVGTDDDGHTFVVELLEDGNIVMTGFFPGEGDAVIDLAVYLQHPEE